MRYILFFLFLIFSAPVFTPTPVLAQVPSNTGVCLNEQEKQLTVLVNNHRVANGLQPVPVSYWLSTVGQWHAWDLTDNAPIGGVCNIHSWSNAMPVLWQPVCYTSDHAQAAQMWGKPRQISANIYGGNGFENAAVAGVPIDAQTAFIRWLSSPGHNAVMLNQGVWAGIQFGGMGVGIHGNYATLWFGDSIDVAGGMPQCNNDFIFSNSFE